MQCIPLVLEEPSASGCLSLYFFTFKKKTGIQCAPGIWLVKLYALILWLSLTDYIYFLLWLY
jgi:hypothetical protein